MKTLIILLSLALVSTRMVAGVPDAAGETKPLEKGAAAPNPVVRGLDGASMALDKVLNGEPTILVFYRGSWCPYCVKHLSELQQVKDELSGMGWNIVGISPDKPENLKAAMEKAETDYTLVSDSDMTAAKAFGVAFQVQDDTLRKYKGYGISLNQASGKSHNQLPVPSVFAIDAEGKIRYVYTNPDYKVRLSGEELLQALK
jgi:peroxiredoxin